MSLYKAARTAGAVKRLAKPGGDPFLKASAVLFLASLVLKKPKGKNGKWGIGGL